MPRYVLVLIIAVGAILRFLALEKNSLWLDEITSIQIAAKSIPDILAGVGFDRHTPPFYYLVLHYWQSVTGTSAFALRSFSALIDILNIALMANVFSRMFNRGVGLWAALLYALSPFALFYAQEGRMYTLLVLLVLTVAYLALNFVERRQSLISYVVLLFVCIAGMYTHYYFALSLLGITIGLSVALRKHLSLLGRWWAVMILVGIAYLPWLEVIRTLAGSGGQTHRKFVFTVLPYTFLRFTAGYAIVPLNYGAKNDILQTALQHLPVLLLYAIVFGLLTLYSLRVLSSHPRERIWLLLTPLILPPLIALLISLKVPMLGERYLIVVLPFFLSTLALGLNEHTEKTRGFLLAVGTCALFIFALYQYYFSPNFGKVQWKSAASYIAQSSHPARRIFVRPPYTDGILRYYLAPAYQVIPGSDKALGAVLEQDSSSTEASDLQFWLVERGTERTFVPELLKRGFVKDKGHLLTLGNGIRISCLSHLSLAENELPASPE